jgi:hypothetical protein
MIEAAGYYELEKKIMYLMRDETRREAYDGEMAAR